MSKDTHRHPLVLPVDLHQKLKALADKDRRPLNSYLVLKLEQFVAEEASNG